MATARKITVMLPERLLLRAMATTGEGITPTIRQGLELVAAGRAYARLQGLKGKVRFSTNVRQLREDR